MNMASQSMWKSRAGALITQHFAPILLWLLPSFCRGQTSSHRAAPHNKQRASSRAHGTLFLDGLRGVSSLIVFVRHFLVPWEPTIDTGFAQQQDGQQPPSYNVARLPVVRLLYAGPTVPVFFVVSGFLLAHRPLRLIHAAGGSDDDDHGSLLFRSLAASIFRRAPRLLLPPVVSTLTVAVAVYLGAYETAPYAAMPGDLPAARPPRLDTLAAQLTDWARFVVYELAQPWDWRRYEYAYDTHLYTIPIQLRASAVVFLLLVGLARVTRRLRLAILGLLWAYLQQQRRWDVGLFVAGVMIRATAVEMPIAVVEDRPGGHQGRTRWRKLGWRIILVLGIYLGSFPRRDGAGAATPGYLWLSMLTGKFVYWHSYGATAMLLALSKDAQLQSCFINPIFDYLGRISFSLYLVHGPMLHVFGYSLTFRILGLVDQGSNFQYQSAVLAALFCVSVPTFWVADFFWRTIDQSCGTLVARLERACFVS